jgi:predicted permease
MRGQPIMRIVREWTHRLWGTLIPGRRDRELAEELRLHLELTADAARRRGVAPSDAMRVARLRAGRESQTMAVLRDQRGLPVLANFIQDIRHALRALRKAPGFVATTVFTLALGIGATAVVFSAVDAILVRPLAVEAPRELFVVRRVGEPRARFAFDFYRSLRESRTIFTDVLASFTFPVTVVDAGTGTRARAAFVTPNYFALLGVPPQLGRLFGDDRDGAVVVISHRFWKERFGGRGSVVGESVRVGGAPFVIGGITPPGFAGLQLDIAIDLWLSISSVQAAVPIPSFRPAVDIVGRLAPELSLAAANSRASIEYDGWIGSAAPVSTRRDVRPLSLVSASHGLGSGVRDAFRTSFPLVLAICTCLWIITIVNVSGLLTARLKQRSREIGIRLALGVTSARLFAQLLAEGVVLVAAGFVLGLLMTVGLIGSIPRWFPSWAGVDIRASPLVLITLVVTASLAAIVMTVMQVLSVDHRRVLSHLSPALVSFRRGRRLRLSTCLVGAQLTLTFPLIVAAGLLAQTLYRLEHVDTGFDRSNLLQIGVEPVLVGYSAERAKAYYAALLERLRAVPGITGASVSSGGALSRFDGIARVRRQGGWQDVRMITVDDQYFQTMGIRLLSGRSFDRSDVQRIGKVVVLNDALAQRLFGPDGTTVGQEVTVDGGRTSDRSKVVGVVENTAEADVRDRQTPTAYLPVGDSTLLIVHLRTLADPSPLIPAIRRTVTSLDPAVPILGIDTIESRRHQALEREQLMRALSAAVGWLALAVSAIGLFGRVSHDVATRTQEIGIRSALGARRSQIAGLFLRDTAGIVLLSVVFGIAAALTASRVLQGLLYGVSATSLKTYVAAACLMAGVAAVATILPLRIPNP